MENPRLILSMVVTSCVGVCAFLGSSTIASADLLCNVAPDTDAVLYRQPDYTQEERVVMQFDPYQFVGNFVNGSDVLIYGQLFDLSMRPVTDLVYGDIYEWTCAETNVGGAITAFETLSGEYNMDLKRCGGDSEGMLYLDESGIYFYESSCYVTESKEDSSGVISVIAECSSEGETYLEDYQIQTLANGILIKSDYYGDREYFQCN